MGKKRAQDPEFIRQLKQLEKGKRITKASRKAKEADASVKYGNVESSTTAKKLYCEAKRNWPDVQFSAGNITALCIS